MHFDLDERPEINKSIGKAATGMFWGDMRTQVKPGMEKRIRGGYAGFRNKAWCFFFWQKGFLIIGPNLFMVVRNISRQGRRFLGTCWTTCQDMSILLCVCVQLEILARIIHTLSTYRPMVQYIQTYGSIGFISVDKIIHGKTYSYVLFYNHDIYVYYLDLTSRFLLTTS